MCLSSVPRCLTKHVSSVNSKKQEVKEVKHSI